MSETKVKGTSVRGNIKPQQSIAYDKKDKDWREANLEYFINSALFDSVSIGVDVTEKDLLSSPAQWYRIYNNEIDESLFNYITNPLNSTTPIYKSFPARIRPLNIIRPIVDLLVGEYSKRLFKFDVVNLDGDGVVNSFLDAKLATFKKNVTDRLVAEIEKAKGEQGAENIDIPNPATLMDDLNSNYKDLKALKGYKALKLIEHEQKLREKLKDMFKDWIIAGEVTSIKGVKRSILDYDRLSPLWVKTDKSTHVKNYEDGSYSVARFRMTVADLVDRFYEDMKESDLLSLEADEETYRANLYTHFTHYKKEDKVSDKADVYYVTWKSRKKIGFLSYNDPVTGEPLTLEVDESYKVDKEAGETCEWVWVNEVWEGWRINDDIYIGIKPINVQRNEMNNHSSCKLPINGRKFSDTEANNTSVVALGIPYQIMFIILNFRIELMIAKSKGKIALLDKNTIGDSSTGGQEETLYYAEALGYMLIDRDAEGVDRSWNQYSVLDMSLFDQIKQLVEIARYYKDSWEELLGISRQRKGDVSSSDGKGTTEEAIFRSSIISDIIFSTFDEFVESELQGLLDLSKFAWIDGKLGYYRNDDGRMELFSVDPEDFVTSSLGVFVDLVSQLQPKLDLMKQQINAIAQRKDIKLSTVADLIFTESYAELKAKLKKAEAIEAEIARQTAENEAEREKELEKIKEDYAVFNNFLEKQLINTEWDRRDNNEIIKGEIAGRVAKTPSGMDIDMNAIVAESNKRLSDMNKTSLEREKIRSNEKIAAMKDKTEKEKIAASLKNKVVGER